MSFVDPVWVDRACQGNNIGENQLVLLENFLRDNFFKIFICTNVKMILTSALSTTHALHI